MRHLCRDDWYAVGAYFVPADRIVDYLRTLPSVDPGSVTRAAPGFSPRLPA
jgi:hypothetical protein